MKASMSPAPGSKAFGSLATALAAIFMLSGAPSARAQDRPALDAVTLHLFLEKSGQLSPDVAAIADFKSWNSSPSGAGLPDGDLFEAILIEVHFTSKNEIFAKGRQATVTVKHRRTGKVLMRRSIRDVYIDRDGKVTKPVFLDGHSCTPLIVTVASGKEKITKTLDLECGE